jgi:hypothetical protein
MNKNEMKKQTETLYNTIIESESEGEDEEEEEGELE